jgi:FkbM family methyltransferase
MNFQIKKRILQFLKKIDKKIKYPYDIKLNSFGTEQCKFRINNPIESYRIEQFGDEKEFTQLIINELRFGDIFFDIGANVGLVTVHAAKKCKFVYSFEPEYKIRERLEKNIQMNSLKNVKIIDWAVSDKKDQVCLFSDGVEGRSPSLRNEGGRKSMIVNCNSIDNAIAEKDMPNPDVIKLDIEGAEAPALKGMMNLLSSEHAPRTIFIEVHSTFLQKFNSSEEEILQFLHQLGYSSGYNVVRDEQVHYIFKKI